MGSFIQSSFFEFCIFMGRVIAILACAAFAMFLAICLFLEQTYGKLGTLQAIILFTLGESGTILTICSMLLLKRSRLHTMTSWGGSATWLVTLFFVIAFQGFEHTNTAWTFLLWFVQTFMAVALPPRRVKRWPSDTCGGCGYNLKGLTEAKCPECGKENLLPDFQGSDTR